MKKEQNGIMRVLSPGFVMMSVMIGGGFATGREIVQYGGQYGAAGWVVGLAIALGFSILCMISFEIARRYKAYDYRTHLKIYAGPLAILYDVLFFVSCLLCMSVMASATGEILKTTMGLPYYVGVVAIIVISAIINFFGQKIVEKTAVIGAIVLYVGYISFAILAIVGRTDNIGRVFSEYDTSFAGVVTPGLLIWAGLVYVGYNVQPMTTCFFVCNKLKTKKEALIAGGLAGFIILVPWALTYVAIMAFYPDESVLGAGVPWLMMMMNVNKFVVIIFGIIAGWTLVATCVGNMNAITDRIDRQRNESQKAPLSSKIRSLITIGYLGGAVIMSKFGIIAIVSKGYTAMSIGIMVAFIAPIITVGVYKLCSKKGKEAAVAIAEANEAKNVQHQ